MYFFKFEKDKEQIIDISRFSRYWLLSKSTKATNFDSNSIIYRYFHFSRADYLFCLPNSKLCIFVKIMKLCKVICEYTLNSRIILLRAT